MAGKNIDSFYKCCFCSFFIEPLPGILCEIDILINIDKSKKEQYNQVFYCHMTCLKKQFHSEFGENYFYLESLVQSKTNSD